MKRRVLRAHANKRCLRILSASHQLQTPSTATTADRAYAVLCDASFLRAIVLAYWQAHAPAEWREARKRLLRKAAAAAAAAAADASSPLLHGPTAASSRSSVVSQGDDASAPEAGNSEGAKEKGRRPKSVRPPLNPIAAVSRLPARLPAHSPVEFLRALMNDAFQGSSSSSNNSSNSAAEAGARQKSRSGGSPSSRRRGGDDDDDDSNSDGDWDGDADEAEGMAQGGGVGGGQPQTTRDKHSAHHTGNGRGGGGSRDAPNAPQHRTNAAVTTRSKQKSLPFVFHCLPETVAALHRMHDSTLHDDDGHSERAHGSKGKAGGDDHQQGTPRRSPSSSSASACTNPKKAAPFSHHDTSVATPQRTQQQSETERWLAASFGALASTTGTMRGQSATGGGASASSSSFYHGQFNALSTTTTSANSGGGGGGSAVSPLTFQEVPAAVVSALLSGLSLLQDPSQSAAVTQDSEDSAKGMHDNSSNSSNQKKTTDGHSSVSKSPTPPATHRNEAKMMAAFMAFNTACLTYGESSTAAAELASSSGLGRLRLCSIPPFVPTPDTSAVMGHHALKRLRRRQKQQQQQQMNETGASVTRGSANTHTNAAAAAADGSASVSAPSKPYAPRSYFVATQSHDVRRRLPPATALLRLTTNPDALWIEQRGVAYRYDSDDGGAHAAGGTSVNNKSRRLHETPGTSAPHGPSSTDDLNRRGKRSRSSDANNSHSRSGSHARTASATPTVVAAAPQLSRADVAFMKHLGTATHVPLPEKRASAAAPLHGGDGGVQAGGVQTAAGALLAPSSSALTAGKSDGAAQSNAAAGQRRRTRQKGQNPLSMKKKQKREVFRA